MYLLEKFKPKRASDGREIAIRWLTVSLAVAIGMVVHSHIKLANMPENFTCYSPPNIAVGGTTRVNETPSYIAYAFAFRLYQNIESCLETCESDRMDNIALHRWYMTDSYYAERMREARSQGRHEGAITRTVSEYSKYSPELVKPLGAEVWVVNLDVRITDKIGSRVISDSVYRLPIRVVGYDVERSKNPWKIALDGYQGTPERLYSLLEGEQ